ncbi:MAG: hypothetical protein L3K26_19805 [Candidatus Hydrogenedentes bacterium]|nr:hypothetical protein [Candidatus Hydrogenedentota bacterium]
MAVSIQLKAASSSGVYREVVDFHFEVEGSSDIVQVPVEVYGYVMSESG